jgi:hypothetical protein
MYGLVNKAIEDLVRNHHGDATWDRIRREAAVDVEVFVSNQAYPDDITYRLIGSASSILDVPAEAILESFGEYWMLFTARTGYGDLLEQSGNDWKDFILNLPNFHTRLGLIFPELQPPVFDCAAAEGDAVRVDYNSRRTGLAPMVVGLLKGIGRLYSTELAVQQIASRAEGESCDSFLVQPEAH